MLIVIVNVVVIVIVTVDVTKVMAHTAQPSWDDA